MYSKSTLKAARSHIDKKLRDANSRPALAADAMVYEVARDCIDFCIQEVDAAAQRRRIDEEIDMAIARIMAEPKERRGGDASV